MDMSKYKTMFVNEAREQLAQMDVAAAQLQRTPENKELIDQLFRQAHSLKGMAASMQYAEITELAHALEDLMSEFRAEGRHPQPDVVSLLVEGIDVLSAQVDARDEGNESSDPRELRERIRQQVSAIAEPPGASLPAEVVATQEAPKATAAAAGGVFDVRFSLTVGGTMAGVRGFLAYKRLSTLGAIVSSVPELASIKKGHFSGPVRIRLRGPESAEEIDRVLGAVSDVSAWEVRPVAGPLLPEESGAEDAKPAPPGGLAKRAGANRAGSTVRVPTSFLDYFINVVGELAIIRSHLSELAEQRKDGELSEVSDRLEAQVRDLYAEVMSVRLMPLESITSILPRTVRELARKHERELSFEMAGQDLEVDRSVLEVVLDPLIHILRNAVDHGIEAPEEREAAGKPRRGAIRILAYRERDQTIIQVSDDGRGLDLARLRRKAVEMGQLTPEAAERLSDHEACQLVCLPGLSTAEAVTETSGRGVGMDAVHASMERIGGSLTIDSVPGKGTVFRLTLPRSVAIVPVLLARARGEIFAFPLTRVARTLVPDEVEIQSSRGRQYCVVDEESVPLLKLAELLRVPNSNGAAPEGQQRTSEGGGNLILIDRESSRLVVEVDALLGHQEAFIKPLGRPLDRIRCLSGATVLGSGRPVFVIDAAELYAQMARPARLGSSGGAEAIGGEGPGSARG